MSAARKLAYLTADDIADRKSCFNCIHLDHELVVEDAQDERQNWMRYECIVCPQISNLRAFPFGTTKCKRYRMTRGFSVLGKTSGIKKVGAK